MGQRLTKDKSMVEEIESDKTEETLIYEDDIYIIKKPEHLNYRIYDKSNNICAKYEIKENSIYIDTIKYLSCEIDCDVEIRSIQNMFINIAKLNNKAKLGLMDTSYMYIYYGNKISLSKEIYNLKYIYLFIDPNKHSYHMKNYDYIYMYSKSPFYVYIIKNLVRIVDEYDRKYMNNTDKSHIIVNCKSLQHYSRYCYQYDNNILKNGDVKKYNNYIEKIRLMAPEFKRMYRSFKEYIDYYTDIELKKYVLESSELYDDEYYKKIYNRAKKNDFRISAIFNDDIYYIIKEN